MQHLNKQLLTYLLTYFFVDITILAQKVYELIKWLPTVKLSPAKMWISLGAEEPWLGSCENRRNSCQRYCVWCVVAGSHAPRYWFSAEMGCNVTAGEVPIRGGRGDAIYVQSEHTLCSGYFLTPCGCALIFSRGWWFSDPQPRYSTMYHLKDVRGRRDPVLWTQSLSFMMLDKMINLVVWLSIKSPLFWDR